MIRRLCASQLPFSFKEQWKAASLDYLNPDCDAYRLAAQLKGAHYAKGAICLYGPPGMVQRYICDAQVFADNPNRYVW